MIPPEAKLQSFYLTAFLVVDLCCVCSSIFFRNLVTVRYSLGNKCEVLGQPGRSTTCLDEIGPELLSTQGDVMHAEADVFIVTWI